MEEVQSSVHGTSAFPKALEKKCMNQSFVEETFINMIAHD